MPRRLLTIIASVAAMHAARAQGSVASRAASVRDGIIRMEFPSRAGACGNGRDMVSVGRAFFSRDMESWGSHWSNGECHPGNARVAIPMESGQPTHVSTTIGGSWPPAEGKVNDLGVVSARDASAYLFSLVPRGEHEMRSQRILLPAVIALDAPVLSSLRQLANDEARTTDTRRQAIQWFGVVGDASVIPELMRFAHGGDAGERRSLSGAAISALAELPEDAGVPSLLALSHDSSTGVRHDVVFWLGQTEDPRAAKRLHEIIEDTAESTNVRRNALFALGQDGQVPTSDLVTAYRTLDGAALKEQAIFVLSERDDKTAIDALIDIARADPDHRMRGKAMFWLAQKHDPRVTRLLSDILVK